MGKIYTSFPQQLTTTLRGPFHTAIPKDYVLQLYNSILHNPAAVIQIKCVKCTRSVKIGSFRNSCQASSPDGKLFFSTEFPQRKK